MTLSAKNHGAWVRYQPDKPPERYPQNVMYCKRESDGVDWYEYLYRQPSPFAADTVKITLLNVSEGKPVVQAATRDATALFPQNCTLIELSGSDAADPQVEYGGKEYAPPAGAWDTVEPKFAAPAPFMMALSDRQFFQELALRGLITKQEALATVRGGALPAKLQAIINTLSSDDQFDAEMWIAGDALDRKNRFMEQFRAALGLSDAEFDELWRHAMTLGNVPPPSAS